MKHLAAFFGIGAIFFAIWMVQAWVFDFAAGFVSYDYIPPMLASAQSTLERGIFLSSLFGAFCCVPVSRLRARVRSLAAAIVCVPLITGFAVCAGAGFLYMSYSLGTLDISAWHLAFPRRHAIYRGMEFGYQAGSWVALMTACYIVWRARFVSGN